MSPRLDMRNKKIYPLTGFIKPPTCISPQIQCFSHDSVSIRRDVARITEDGNRDAKMGNFTMRNPER